MDSFSGATCKSKKNREPRIQLLIMLHFSHVRNQYSFCYIWYSMTNKRIILSLKSCLASFDSVFFLPWSRVLKVNTGRNKFFLNNLLHKMFSVGRQKHTARTVSKRGAQCEDWGRLLYRNRKAVVLYIQKDGIKGVSSKSVVQLWEHAYVDLCFKFKLALICR